MAKAKKITDDRKAELEQLILDIEGFKFSTIYKYFKGMVDSWIADEYREGWECEESKPADMKLAQAKWHALQRARRIFDLPAQSLKAILESEALEKETHPIFDAGEGIDNDL